ncbi:NAD(P)-binding protein [Xylaria arbuscula]|nr:NAD(P)-binding protein [Xylaria arbuscula]
MGFTLEKDIPDLKDKVILVTGGNSGLGYETVRHLAQHNPAHIYLAARSVDKGNAAIKQIQESTPNACPISLLTLDLSSFGSIKAAARTFRERETRLDILVNNAGIMMFGTNHLGHALLTNLLLPVLEATTKLSPDVRVVTVSSATELRAPEDVYNFEQLKTTCPDLHTTTRYGISKLANLHYSSALARHYEASGIKFICTHPGAANTNLHRDSNGFFLRLFLHAAIPFLPSAETGALNQIWATVSPDARNGGLYAPVGKPWSTSKNGQNAELGEELFSWTQKELRQHLGKS